jgi:nucleotide-binding universal stress UspA family protein
MTSSLRQILVHLDHTEATPQRLSCARRIAQQHGASLAALYAVSPSFVELPYAPEIGPAFAATLLEIDEGRRNAVLKAFDAEMTLPGPMATWSQTDNFPIYAAVAQQARYADLLVLGQHDIRDQRSRQVPPEFVPDVLMASGRPALVLPFVGWSGGIGATVAIAWKETPEAARAVQAALPFLERASKVHVFSWGEEGTPRLGGRGLDFEQYLRVHGIEATWHREGEEPAALGDLLLSRVCDVCADLLVMGCYGHSRTREWILGGVSRTALATMTLPVLMSY